jgi:hypothetical protein
MKVKMFYNVLFTWKGVVDQRNSFRDGSFTMTVAKVPIGKTKVFKVILYKTLMAVLEVVCHKSK